MSSLLPPECTKTPTESSSLSLPADISALIGCIQVYSVTIGSWQWREHTPEVDGDVPTPRSGHTAVALPDGRHLAVFGGGDANRDIFYSSVSILDTVTWRWSTPKIQVRLASALKNPHQNVCLYFRIGECHCRCHLTDCFSLLDAPSCSDVLSAQPGIIYKRHSYHDSCNNHCCSEV